MQKKLILFNFLFWIAISNTQDAPQNKTANDTLPAIENKIDSAYNSKEPSLLSQIAGWIFPFGGGDSIPSESRDSPYFPPQQQYHPQKQKCNPCNQEPWVPIATKYGHNTIVGYVQPQRLKNDHLYGQNMDQIRPPLPEGGYGGNIFNVQSYDVPLKPQNLPNHNDLFPPSHQNVNKYPPSKHKNNFGSHSHHYQSGNKKPKFLQRPYQPRPTFGNYRPPLRPYTPNRPKIHPSSDIKNPPSKYGPPPFYFPSENFVPPPSNYGPPVNNAPSTNYGIPNPPEPNYGIPNPPEPNYGIPNAPSTNYGIPNAPSSNYGIPNAPETNYGKPNAPSSNYGIPNPPEANYGVPNAPENNYGIPNPPGANYGIPQAAGSNFAPPNINIPPPNFVPPPNNPHVLNYALPPMNSPVPNFAPPFNYALQQNPASSPNFEIAPSFLPPPKQLPNNFNAHPIPLPNLSSGPVAPLHEPQPFNPKYPESLNTHQGDESVQILKSVPVAEYLASVEYPINVIRSPLLEVDVANSTSQAEIPDDLRSLSYNSNNGNKINTHTDQKLAENNLNNNFRDVGYTESPELFENNPIIVEDTHVAASTANHTYESDLKQDESVSGFYDGLNSGFLNQIVGGFSKENVNEVSTEITPPIIEYSNWSPSNELVTTMVPPPIGESVWLKSFSRNEEVTKKPKQIQIIIPYTTNTRDVKVSNNIRTSLPLYTVPPTIESVWMEHFKTSFESKKLSPIPPKPVTEIINIKDLLKENKFENVNNLPFDIIRFQKNIDVWTEQEYSHKFLQDLNKQKSMGSQNHKNIPDEYLTTAAYEEEATTKQDLGDYKSSGSNIKEVTIKDDIETNSIISEGPTSTTLRYHKNDGTNRTTWNKIQIAVSPLTKEKVYVVTPLPTSSFRNNSRKLKENDLESTQTTFSISIKPMKNLTMEKDVKVILSEWPHLINNLETTTSTTSKPSTSRHPLLGLMDLSSFATPANSPIQTFSGHSKVLSAAPTNLKENPKAEEKKDALLIDDKRNL